MSDGERPRRPGPLIAVVIVFALAAAAYLAIELVQRHRFNVLAGEVQELVNEFAAGVRFDIDDGNGLIFRDLSESKGLVPTPFRMDWEEFSERGTTWFLAAALNRKISGKQVNPNLVVFVDQTRGIILGAPRVQVNLVNSTLTAVPDVLDARFKARGLKYVLYAGP